MSSLNKAFERLFDLCANYPNTGHGLPTDDSRSLQGNEDLALIGKQLAENVGIGDWEWKNSKGVGAFPRIPWIIFAQKNSNAPSKGIYVGITFAKNGKGVVAGVICGTQDKLSWKEQITVVPGSWGLPIDGTKKNTKYSNAFITPKGFYTEELTSGNIEGLIEHIRTSIEKISELQNPDEITQNDITSINSRLWIFSPGEGACLWDEQYQNGEAAIGWDALGDLTQYQTRKEITDKLKALENLERNPWNNSLACWQFPNEIKVGDWILVKKGKETKKGSVQCSMIPVDYLVTMAFIE
jgi:hypothetical protein